jgi:hypothetical protein
VFVGSAVNTFSKEELVMAMIKVNTREATNRIA